MKIKKPTKAPGAETTGGAAITDRFKLDPVDNSASRAGTVSKKSATTALSVGLIALAVTIALTVTIYQHWNFLMPV